MDSKLKVTDIPEEASFYDLVSGDNILEIPLFQRPYMWKESHYKTFLKDVETVCEDPSSAVFLGVIVSYSRGSGPGRPPTWMIVDGQQRVTTLYLSIMAAVDVAATNGELDWAADFMGRYLLVRPMSGLTCNTKLIPSFNDRQQFNDIWHKISQIKNFSSHTIYASNPPRPPAPGGSPEGAMKRQYRTIFREFSRQFKDKGLQYIDDRVGVIATKLSVVSISLKEPTVAPKIFERLNFGAEPITVADLVRNEIFARSGDDLQAAQALFDSRWEPFIGRFSDNNSDLNRFLFPYGLIHNSNVKRNDLFVTIRGVWDKFPSPASIIDNLEVYQIPYIALNGGEHLPSSSKSVKECIRRLDKLNRPSSVYPFLLRLLKEYCSGGVDEEHVVSAMDTIESFLFRRAVGGIEPTGLHAVFKGLWKELLGDGSGKISYDLLSPNSIKASIMSRATIAWPSDEELKLSILNGPLYRRKIASYALAEYERGLSDEFPADKFQVEHVAPQKMTDEWKKVIPENYEKIIHTWGNLIPISSEMNPPVGAKGFVIKRNYYAKSKFSSVRKIGKLESWDAKSIYTRSSEIAEWAIKRWPY